MESPDDKRDNEIVKMPSTMEEAQRMLALVQTLQDNLRISASDGGMSGTFDQGFSYSSRAGSDQPEGPEGPEGPEFPEQ